MHACEAGTPIHRRLHSMLQLAHLGRSTRFPAVSVVTRWPTRLKPHCVDGGQQQVANAFKRGGLVQLKPHALEAPLHGWGRRQRARVTAGQPACLPAGLEHPADMRCTTQPLHHICTLTMQGSHARTMRCPPHQRASSRHSHLWYLWHGVRCAAWQRSIPMQQQGQSQHGLASCRAAQLASGRQRKPAGPPAREGWQSNALQHS